MILDVLLGTVCGTMFERNQSFDKEGGMFLLDIKAFPVNLSKTNYNPVSA